MHAERPLPGRRRRSWSTTTRRSTTRSRTAPATSSTRASSTASARARLQRQDHRRARTRRRPTPSRPTRRCCSPTTRTINTKPQLEIFADDVKCTHGATIGQLDEDALFYLRARGIGADRGARHADPRVRRRRARPASRSTPLRARARGELLDAAARAGLRGVDAA